MPIYRKHYDKISKLLIKLDEENERVSKLVNPINERLLKLDLTDNEFGINTSNIKSILLTLEKYKVLLISVKTIKNDVYFMKRGFNEKVVAILKHHYNFDLKSYENEVKEPILIARRSNCIAITSLIVAIIAVVVSVWGENPFDKKIESQKDKLDSLISKPINKSDTLYKKKQPQIRKK